MNLTVNELKDMLDSLVRNNVMTSVLIMGEPGCGKSQIIKELAKHHGISFTDLRLSQLAPTDLRGLPNLDKERKVAAWYPPEFLPSTGRGILFLDEMNQAIPSIQAIAQQLVLDRRVGSYVVPEGWFIWAAGNRKTDMASVYEIPSALANRFLHFTVKSDFDTFKSYALAKGINEQIISFLSFRPQLLHKLEAGKSSEAWPSPRTWEMADRLLQHGLPIYPAVGEGAYLEFESFVKVYSNLPDLDAIIEGKALKSKFPSEPSVRYAIIIGLVTRTNSADKAFNAIKWLADAPREWTMRYFNDIQQKLNESGQIGAFADLIKNCPEAADLMKAVRKFITTNR
jgi:hypothetical protein